MGVERLLQRAMFGELSGGKGYTQGGKGRTCRSLELSTRRVAKGCTEGRQLFSTGGGGSRVIHAEITWRGES